MAWTVEEITSGGHDPLTIAELYDEVEGALARAFPRSRPIWVRGEIHSFSDRTGHCYFDLVDPESAGDRQAPVLKVKCWRTTWGSVKGLLRREGIELGPGMVVVLRGAVDFYRPRAEIGFLMAELDVTALLGRLAAKRAALLRALAAEGLLERNRLLAVPALPLRVGLVASPGTEGYRDFVGRLLGSGFAFEIRTLPATVQGSQAPFVLARAITAASRSECDLVALVRGGGSKTDLGAFDAEPVARAVASSAVPVWTGIGHTSDESVADLVANRAFVTPTECGQELAARVASWWEAKVVAPSSLVARRAHDVLSDTAHRHGVVRGRLAGTVRHQLRWHRQHLVGRTRSIGGLAPLALGSSQSDLAGRVARLVPGALGRLVSAEDQAAARRALLKAYDVERQLERGYTLTTDEHGAVVRSVASVAPGSLLVTRFADGAARSRIETVTPTEEG